MSPIESRLIFKVHDIDVVELLVDFSTATWGFQESFPHLNMFPFNRIKLGDVHFYFTTIKETVQYGSKEIHLDQGLSTAALLLMDFWANKISHLFEGGISEAESFFICGPLDCSNMDNDPSLAPKIQWLTELNKEISTRLTGEWSDIALLIESAGDPEQTTVSFSMKLQLTQILFADMKVELPESGTPQYYVTYAWETLEHPDKLDLQQMLDVLIKGLYIPEGINLTLDDARFIYDLQEKHMTLEGKTEKYGGEAVLVGIEDHDKWNFYFSVLFDRSLEIEKFPMFNLDTKFLAAGQIHYTMSSVPIQGDSDLADKINNHITIESLKIKEEDSVTAGSSLSLQVDVFGLGTRFSMLGDSPCSYQTVSSPVNLNVSDESQLSVLLQPEGQSPITWLSYSGEIGPLKLKRAGVTFQKGELEFVIEAHVMISGLMISLEGLTVSFSLESRSVNVSLNGLGVLFDSGAVTISGSLVGTLESVNFNGSLVISTEDFSIYAIGGYTVIQDEPSLFVYAVLNYPLGGPIFFFVTGLAAGFGFNRLLRVPGDVEGVAEYPFVKWAMGKDQPSMDGDIEALVSRTLSDLSKDRIVEPALGENWLAFGVRFTTFEFIKSFALLTMSFPENDIHLLGYSTLEFPKNGLTFAQAELELMATFSLKRGMLEVLGHVGNAFIFSDQCKVEGDFAFTYWFDGDHEGDFVVSLGGFHPAYKSTHYPDLDRLRMAWNVADFLKLKGEMYFAMDPRAVMGGVKFDALFEISGLSAGGIRTNRPPSLSG
ncbi:DUF6603 domain-containing protein [Paenibacillus polymyxa]|uniref:DUF6603 domain-containing protein n=1 Tax=Paenibacillus polymyxa TaxID=1406 RepID=UPI00234BA6B9|nr:DUF6603 domain-containing protein [Paenibacillus polymyxa]WCM63788.1 hypothetical protein OYT09_13045 [Paenibacillus polymyxa]